MKSHDKKLKKVLKGSDNRRIRMDAAAPMTFTINQDDAKRAKCNDPGQCVVAQALMREFGKVFQGMNVGRTATHIITKTHVIRFSTPSQLRTAIIRFDDTGKWGLPPGEYTLGLYVKRPRRWELAKRKGGKQDTFIARAIPSRRLLRIDTLCNVA